MIVTTKVWLVLQPERRGYDGKVTGIEVDRILKTKPGKLGVRDIAVEMNVEVDEALFTVPQPVVTLRLDDERQLILPTVDAVAQPEPESETEEAIDGD